MLPGLELTLVFFFSLLDVVLIISYAERCSIPHWFGVCSNFIEHSYSDKMFTCCTKYFSYLFQIGLQTVFN